MSGQLDLNKIHVLDGGMGSLIESLGYNCSSTAVWSSGANLTQPELVVDAHKKFIEAGANIILTNTYQANITRLSKLMSNEKALEFVNSGVELAKKAVEESNRPVFIVGSIGPFATYFCDGSEYSGAYMNDLNFNRDLIRTYYEQQARALYNQGIRFLAFETIPTLAEAIYARNVLEDVNCDGWISVTCKDDLHLANGDNFSDLVKNMADSPNVKAIGINCSSPKFIKSLLQAGAPYQKDKVYVVYPNSGEKYDGNAKEFYGNSRVVEIIDELDDWIELGVRVIGGCCRVLPNDIKKIAERVNKMT